MLDVAVGWTNAWKIARRDAIAPTVYNALWRGSVVTYRHSELRSPPIWRVTVVTTSKLHCFYMICPGEMFASRIRNRHHADRRGNSYSLKDAIQENAKIFDDFGEVGEEGQRRITKFVKTWQCMWSSESIEFQRRPLNHRFNLRSVYIESQRNPNFVVIDELCLNEMQNAVILRLGQGTFQIEE